MKRTLWIAGFLLVGAVGHAGNINYVDGPDQVVVPPVQIERAPTNLFAGAYFGIRAGAAFTQQVTQFSEDIYNTGVRDLLQDQCWKFWKNDWNRQLDDRYCSGGFSGMNQHYFDNARLREGVVVGEEGYEYFVRTEEWEETVADDFLIYGLHAGYLHAFGSVIAGVEVSHDFYESKTFAVESVTALKGRAGIALGRIQPYAHVGYAWAGGVDDEGMAYGAGLDLALTARLTVGVQYTHYDFSRYAHDAAVLTASINF